MSQFHLYRKFTDPADTTAITELLLKNNIELEVEDETGPTDYTQPFNILTATYKLNLRSKDFERADNLLAGYYSQQLNNVNPDYFLLKFSDEELIDVVLKEDEWGDYNSILARKILADKGVVIPDQVAARIRTKRVAELQIPQKSEGFWVVLGYASAFMGGLLGMIIGLHLRFNKKTLPSGDRVHVFTKQDRTHGLWILIIGVLVLAVTVILRIARLL